MSDPIPLETYADPDTFGLKRDFRRLGTALGRSRPSQQAAGGAGNATAPVNIRAGAGERAPRSLLEKTWAYIEMHVCCGGGAGVE
ncbi:unnamed protein product [Peniophora sp. CBMAI 1063]|nr:unnamed protein product [Peniophora sp. CBMAI 1063]